MQHVYTQLQVQIDESILIYLHWLDRYPRYRSKIFAKLKTNPLSSSTRYNFRLINHQTIADRTIVY